MSASERNHKRFFAKVHKTNFCWLWRGARTPAGYGRFNYKESGKLVIGYAHRYAFTKIGGGVLLKGMQIDHLCRNPACVNPEHLEAVTPQVNVHRSVSPCAINARKIYCKRGHIFDLINTYISPTGRICRECRRILQRAWYARQGAA